MWTLNVDLTFMCHPTGHERGRDLWGQAEKSYPVHSGGAGPNLKNESEPQIMSLRNMDVSTSEPVRHENRRLQGTELWARRGRGTLCIFHRKPCDILFFKLCTHSIEEAFCNFSKCLWQWPASPWRARPGCWVGHPLQTLPAAMCPTPPSLSLPHSTPHREKEGGPFRINKIKTHKKRLLGQTDAVVQAPEPN